MPEQGLEVTNQERGEGSVTQLRARTETKARHVGSDDMKVPAQHIDVAHKRVGAGAQTVQQQEGRRVCGAGEQVACSQAVHGDKFSFHTDAQ